MAAQVNWKSEVIEAISRFMLEYFLEIDRIVFP